MPQFRLALTVSFFWVILSTHASTASEPGFTGKVIGVSDGETITVLHGIDCPESSQDFGATAKALTSGLTFGKLVNVQPKDRDRYGRTRNDELVRAGCRLAVSQVHSGR